MRRILITPEIEAIAKAYEAEILNGNNYNGHRVDIPASLSRLKKDFEEDKFRYVVDAANTQSIPPEEKIQFESYLTLLRDMVKDKNLLSLMPSSFDSIKTELDTILPHGMFTRTIVKNNSAKHFFYEKVLSAMKYAEVRQYILPKFIRELGIKTCVYCNANYAVTDENGTAYYSLDHWKPKSLYPHLCVSFFNLQPCCYTCNMKKGNSDDTFFNLYTEDPNSLDVFAFNVEPSKYWLTHRRDDIQIGIKAISSSDDVLCGIMNQTFGINSVYAEHRDVAEEILWRCAIYNDANIASLRDSFSNLRLTDEEVQRFINGGYVFPEEIHKRPLSKLIQDINFEI